jgi:hypothetical protein
MNVCTECTYHRSYQQLMWPKANDRLISCTWVGHSDHVWKRFLCRGTHSHRLVYQFPTRCTPKRGHPLSLTTQRLHLLREQRYSNKYGANARRELKQPWTRTRQSLLQ